MPPDEIEVETQEVTPEVKPEVKPDGSKPSGLTKDEVNALIEQAVSQRVNPLQRTIRKFETDRQEKITPIEEENRTTKEQLKALLAERAAEKAQARDINITNHLERAFKSIPEDSIDMVISYVKQTYGAQLDIDSKGKLTYKDEYGEVQSGNAFIDVIMKNPAIGRLLPPVSAPGGRGLRGGGGAGGSKPKFETLSKAEQMAMTSLQVRDYLAAHG